MPQSTKSIISPKFSPGAVHSSQVFSDLNGAARVRRRRRMEGAAAAARGEGFGGGDTRRDGGGGGGARWGCGGGSCGDST